MDVLGRILISLGILSLLHAGFSTIQYKTYLKLTEDDFQYLPIDITVQVLLSAIMCIFGIIRVSGELKDIHIAAELARKSWDTIGNRQSFYCFNHRGQRLFQDMPED